MHALTNLLAVDPSLGRLDYDSLSDQALMEMLVNGLNTSCKNVFQDTKGNFIDVCDWPSIICDADERVTEIRKFSWLCSGTIDFDFIPPNVTKIKLNYFFETAYIHGTLSTALLPRQIKAIEIVHMGIRGSFDLRSLPEHLTRIDISMNAFSGSCNLTALPAGLQKLNLCHNSFSGSVSLENLPASLEMLSIACNKLSGVLRFDSLPLALACLFIDQNGFSGEFNLLKRTSPIRINASANNFSGTAFVNVVEGIFVALGKNKLTAIVDANGEAHPLESTLMRF